MDGSDCSRHMRPDMQQALYNVSILQIFDDVIRGKVRTAKYV